MYLSKLFIIRLITLLGMVGLGVLTYASSYDPSPAPHQSVVQAQSGGAPVVPKPVPVTYTQDPRVAALMQYLGLDYSHLNLYNSTPPIPSAEAQYSNGAIYMTDWAFSDVPNRILSHEYIHYVQYGMTLHAKLQAYSFFPYLAQLRVSDEYLRGRTSVYTSGQAACGHSCAIDQETEAIACTEMADSRLTPEFVAFCNQWLPRRESTLILN